MSNASLSIIPMLSTWGCFIQINSLISSSNIGGTQYPLLSRNIIIVSSCCCCCCCFIVLPFNLKFKVMLKIHSSPPKTMFFMLCHDMSSEAADFLSCGDMSRKVWHAVNVTTYKALLCRKVSATFTCRGDMSPKNLSPQSHLCGGCCAVYLVVASSARAWSRLGVCWIGKRNQDSCQIFANESAKNLFTVMLSIWSFQLLNLSFKIR